MALTTPQRKAILTGILETFGTPAGLGTLLGLTPNTAQSTVVSTLIAALGTSVDATLTTAAAKLTSRLNTQLTKEQSAVTATQTALAAL